MPLNKFMPCVAAMCVVGQIESVVAQQNQSDQFAYRVISAPIEDFLQTLAYDAGVRIQLSESVHGRLSRLSARGTIPEVLDAVTSRNELDWFLYNGVYYVSGRDEVMTRIIRLGDLPFEKAVEALRESGLVDLRYPIRSTGNGSAISITAPPRLVVIVEAIIEGIPSEVAQNSVIVRRGVSIDREIVDKRDDGNDSATDSEK